METIVTLRDQNPAEVMNNKTLAAPVPARFVVLRLTDLHPIKCRDKDEVQDAIRSLRGRSVAYAAFSWHEGAKTYTQLETHE